MPATHNKKEETCLPDGYTGVLFKTGKQRSKNDPGKKTEIKNEGQEYQKKKRVAYASITSNLSGYSWFHGSQLTPWGRENKVRPYGVP